MFWGKERLKIELKNLYDCEDWDEKRIDSSAYTLRVGPEIYVSPTGEPNDPRNKPKTRLELNQDFSIPAGQFGFILTEDVVRVPKNAIAFISIRARYKFKGLVNVSGFHVDPGYEGRLLFSVFNASPRTIQLQRGDPCFLIWYADLDTRTPKTTSAPKDLDPFPKKGFNTIPPEHVGPLADGLQSFANLQSKITQNEKAVTDRLNSVEREQAVIKWGVALLVGAVITFSLRECTPQRGDEKAQTSLSETTQPLSQSVAVPQDTPPPASPQNVSQH